MGKMYLNGHLYGSGGGTEYVETELWSSSSGQEFYPSSPYIATLSDVITNYNLLAFTFSSITDTAFKFTTIVPVSVIDKSGTESFNTVVIGGNLNNTPTCYYVDDTHIAIAGWSSQNHMKIYSIIGIRCGATRKYSTNEQIVGTWIDGSTLYESVITGLNITFPNNYSWTDAFATSLGIADIVDVKLYDTSGVGYPIKLSIDEIQAYNGGIRVRTSVSNLITYRAITRAIIQYTKTTD